MQDKSFLLIIGNYDVLIQPGVEIFTQFDL